MKRLATILSAVVALSLPLAAQAHKAFLLPSQTVLANGPDKWITVDAARSNDLFYFNHHGLDLDNLVITGPEGEPVAATNKHESKWRTTFDVELPKEGTYKLAIASHGAFARYEVDGERKRQFAAIGELDIPDNAEKVEVNEFQNRLESFVTVGAPNDAALQPTGKGLELVPITHPNNLYATETADFQLLLDGKPAKQVKVTVIRGGTRYRLAPNAIHVTTDDEGKFSITWPQAGRYWLGARVSDDNTSFDKASKRSAGYSATFEVLPL